MLIRLQDYMVPVKALSKPHKGVVVDNNDPKKLGRVKCTIEGLYESSKEDLPWITSSIDPSNLTIPEIGDELKIEFPFNNIYSPEFTGYYHSDKNHNSVFDINYPNTFGFSKGGLNVLHNKTSGESSIVHPSGATINLDSTGKLELNLPGGLSLVFSGDYLITATGSIKFSATGDIDLKSDGIAKLVGKGSTIVGSSSSLTKVDGSSVLLAGGGLPVALLSGQVIGPGNLGVPVVSNIIEGSSKVLAPK